MRASYELYNKTQKKLKRLVKRCVKQLNRKDRVTFFKQLDSKLQHETFEELDYEQATELEEDLKK